MCLPKPWSRAECDRMYILHRNTVGFNSVLRPPASHHEIYPNQTNQTRRALLEKQDELISDELLWTPAYGHAKAGRPARTYIQQLCEDTGCSPEDLLEAMNDREKWQERVRDIHACGTT